MSNWVESQLVVGEDRVDIAGLHRIARIVYCQCGEDIVGVLTRGALVHEMSIPIDAPIVGARDPDRCGNWTWVTLQPWVVFAAGSAVIHWT